MTDEAEAKKLSAAERRERRLKRILGNSEERMKRILSGPDGDEHRLPPMLEGGEYRSSSLFTTSEDDNSAMSDENGTDSNLSTSNSSQSSQHPIFKSIRRMDKPLNLFFGIFVRILMAYGFMFNALTPWMLIFFGSHLFTIVKETPKFFNDVMTILRSGSYSTLERIFRRGHAALAFLRLFTSRLLIMVSGFLIGHSALIIYHKLPKELTSLHT